MAETMSESQLQTLCAALGWQGGTYWQVVDEIRRLREESDTSYVCVKRMGDLLTGVANALRGPPPPLTLWSWHDLPDRAAAAIAAIDVMQRAALMAADEVALPQDKP